MTEELIKNVYVINLDKDTERWNKTSKQVIDHLNIQPKRVPGVYGKELTKEEIKSNTSGLYKRLGSKSVIGCAMSHVNAWKEMLNNGDESALILEDDVKIDPEIIAKLDRYSKDIPEDYYLIYLGCSGLCSKDKKYSFPHTMMRVINYKNLNKVYQYSDNVYTPSLPVLFHAYIISRKCADYLLRRVEEDKIKFHIDYQILSYIKDKPVYAIEPKLVFQENVNLSTSNNISIEYPKMINKCLSFEDEQGIPFNYLMTVSHYEIFGYVVNIYTYLIVILAVILGYNKTSLNLILFIYLLYHIPEWYIFGSKETFVLSIVYLLLFLLFYWVSRAISNASS